MQEINIVKVSFDDYDELVTAEPQVQCSEDELNLVLNDIYNAVRAIGIGIFMVNIAFTAITLSNKNNGKDIAGAKATIAFTAILALLFVFAQNIMGFITKLLGDLEGLM